jgi:hypothetical protein
MRHMRRTRRNRPESLTDSPAFKRWFGKSKVVDAEGKPLVVYHGTLRGGFTSFDLGKIDAHHSGFFFTSSRAVAESYGMDDPLPRPARPLPDLRTVADIRRFVNSPENIFEDGWRLVLGQSQQVVEPEVEDYGLRYTGTGAEVVTRFFPFWERDGRDEDIGDDYYYPPYTDLVRDVRAALRRGGPTTSGIYAVYLRMLKPLVVQGKGAFWSQIPYRGGYFNTAYITADAKARGYDGVIFRDIYDSSIAQTVASDVYVAFEPTQIKSATANVGTFDPTDPDIRRNPAPRVPRGFRDLAAWSKWADGQGVDLRLSRTPYGGVEITDLFAHTTGTGAGTRVVTALVSAADTAGMPLVLEPSSRRNITFYERFGFAVSPRGTAMIRSPRRSR